MGNIYVKLENVATEINQTVAQKIIATLSKMPGGDDLIQKATADGDITIHLGKNIAGFFGGHWDYIERYVRVNIDLPPNEFLENEEAQDEAFDAILFELCNAANPLLKPQALKDPLEHPNVEAFVRDSEYREFKSFQMKAKIVNAAIENKLGSWDESDKLPVFADDAFNKYFQEIPEKVLQVDGEQKAHSDNYRDIYNITFRLFQNSLVLALENADARSSLSALLSQSGKALTRTTPLKPLHSEFKDKISLLLEAKSIKDYEEIIEEYKARGLDSVDLFDSEEQTKFIERGVHQMKSRIGKLENMIGELNSHLNEIKIQSELLVSKKDKIHPNVADLLKINEVIKALKQKSDPIHALVQAFQKIKAAEEENMQYYAAFIPEFKKLSSQLVDLKSHEAQMFAEAKKISMLTQSEAPILQDFENVFGKDSVKINKSANPSKK